MSIGDHSTDNNRERDIGKPRVYTHQGRDIASMAEAKAQIERKRILDLRAALRGLEPNFAAIRPCLTRMRSRRRRSMQVARLVLRVISLGGEDKLPVALLDEFGLRFQPNPAVQVEGNDKASF